MRSGPPSPFVSAVLARLPAAAGLAVVRDGADVVVGVAPQAVRRADGAAALSELDGLDRRGGWWAGWLAYDLGRAIERVTSRTVDDVGIPDLWLARFDARLVFPPGRPPRLEGRGEGRRLLAAALAGAQGTATPRARDLAPPALDRWASSLSHPEWNLRVGAVLELLSAGECYQVNLTRRLTADRPVDPVALFAALHARHAAPHAALVVPPPDGAGVLTAPAVVSASPERFLARVGDRVETRPVKGTDVDPGRLAASAKDHAENVMIVDLARNDLGRVCRYGSIAVPSLCALESHPGLHHLVSTVRGRLRPDVGTGALLAATLPPASVTGAPKPRVLQAIEDLEPVRRGIYCGAVGWIDADRARADLAVAIRTFTCTPAQTSLGVGSGIVADSDPDAEWRETEVKAARLLAIAGTGTHGRAPQPAGSR